MAMGLGLGLVPPPQVVLQNMGDEDASMVCLCVYNNAAICWELTLDWT